MKKIEVSKKGNKFYFSIDGVASPSAFFSEGRARQYARGIISRNENLSDLIKQARAE